MFDTETNATGRAAELCQLSAVDQSDHSTFSGYIRPNNAIDKYATSGRSELSMVNARFSKKQIN